MRRTWLFAIVDVIEGLLDSERRERAEAGCRHVIQHWVLVLGITTACSLLGGLLLHGAAVGIPILGELAGIRPTSLGWFWSCLIGGSLAIAVTVSVIYSCAPPPSRRHRQDRPARRPDTGGPSILESLRMEPSRGPWAIALDELSAWTASRPSPAVAWAECPRGDWMLELAAPGAADPVSPGRRRLVLAAAACARRAMGRAGPPDGRGRRFLDGAESWARSTLREAPDSLWGDYAEAAGADGRDFEADAALAVADAVAAHAAGRSGGDPRLDALVADPDFLRRAADAAAFRAAALAFDPTNPGLVVTFAALAEAGGPDPCWRKRVVAALGSMAEEIRGLYPPPRSRAPRRQAPPSRG